MVGLTSTAYRVADPSRASARRVASLLLSCCARGALLAVPVAASLGITLPAQAQTVLGSSGTTVDLAAHGGAAGNPFVIDPASVILSTGNGVDGAAASYTLTNSGLVEGGAAGTGIRLQAGSTVTNTTSGSISGGYYGLHLGHIGSGASSVTNAGVITGTIAAASDSGIYLGGGGSITNATTGSIFGAVYGLRLFGATTVTNQGTITGATKTGVYLEDSGTVTVNNSGTITGTSGFGAYLLSGGTVTNSGTASRIAGGQDGVKTRGAAGTVTNEGTITGTADAGVYLMAGGSVTNSGTASGITGLLGGVKIRGAAGTVTNEGTITGTADAGVYLTAGGTVTNSGTASKITGQNAGVVINGTGTVINEGTMTGAVYGVKLLSSGSVTNSGTLAKITGPLVGVFIGTTGTVTNEGTISGAADSGIHLGAGGTVINSGTIIGSTLIVDPAAIKSGGPLSVTNSGLILGNITAWGQAVTIAGGTGGAVGTLTGQSGGLGTIAAQSVTFSGGSLLLNDNIISGAVSNTGATLKLTAPVTITGNYAQSSGVLDLGTSGQLAVSGTATVTGGTFAISLSNTANYIAGGGTTLISAGAGSSYSGVTVSPAGFAGLLVGADTTSTTNLVATYLNDYIGGNLASLSNTGTLNGSAYGIYVAATGTLSALNNTGTISGSSYAIYNLGSLGAIANSGAISGNISSTGALTINGGSGSTFGTLSGGTIAAPGLTFASGNLNLSDNIDVGNGTVSNTGATLKLTAPVTITGNYAQSSGALDLGPSGQLAVSGTATVTGGTVAISLSNTANYIAGGSTTLISAGAGSSYAGATVSSTGITGLSASTNTASTTNLVATYLNDYIGGNLASLSNTGTLSGSAYGVYVAATGALGGLTNNGTLGGSSYAIYNLGSLGTIANSGTISGNISSTGALTINGGSGSTFGTLSGGTITGPGLTFASGNLNLNDNIDAGSGTVSNTGATLKLPAPVTITGNYAQSSGVLDLGTSGQLAVSGTANITGGTVAVDASAGNHVAGGTATLITAGSGSSYSGVTINLTGLTGLSASVDTTSTTNLVVTYLNDTISGNLASLSNTGALSGSAYAVYVASTGTLGTLNNTGTISGSQYDIYIAGTLTSLNNSNHIGSPYGVYVASTGTLTSLSNSGTISGDTYAIYSAGILGPITNSGTIAGNIASANALTISGGSGSTFGTLSGGTITAPGLTFASGNLNLSDNIDVGSGTVSNTGATLQLSSAQNITGKFSQTAGVLSLGPAGELIVSGTASISGGSVQAGLDPTGNYLAGTGSTLISAGAGSSYAGATVALTGITGLSVSADTISTTNLVATFLNDYIGGNLASLSNTGTLSGSAYGVYVASTGTLSTLNNTGTISGSSYAIYNLGSLGTIANSGTISGNISSTGALTINGGSTFGRLSGGTITATSVNFVSGHTLLADNINVGTGTVNNSGATLELASKVAITGNYVQSGGALVSDVASTTSYGSLQVSGSATVTGASITISGATVKAGQTYTIVDASGASTYANNAITVVGAHYKAVLTVSGDDLLASIRPVFSDIGKATGGDAAVLGDMFDNLSDVTAMQASITKLSVLSDADLGEALLQAAPAQVSSGAAMLQRADVMNGLIIDAVDQRSTSTAGTGWSLWGQVMGGAAHRAPVAGAEGYKTTTFGMIVGADTRTNDDVVVGAAFSWSEGWNSGVSDLSGNTNRVNSYQLTGYASWQQGALTLNGQAGISFNDYSQRREMRALGEVANAAYSGRQYTMASEGTYSLPLDGVLGGATLMPAVSLRWLHLDTDGYSETGAGSDALKVGASTADQVQSGLGAKLSWAVDTSVGLLVPAIKVLWVHDFIDGATTTDAALGGLGFSTTTARVASDGAKVGAGVTFYRTGAVSLQAEYSGDFRKDYTAHTGRVEVRIAF